MGKSTLINALLETPTLAVGAIREQDDRGKHTTTRRCLITLDDGTSIIDTPGMREFALADASNGVASVFDDVQELAQQCRFRDCTHVTEPGCAVRDSVDESRLENWRHLAKEAAYEARKHDQVAAVKEKQRWKSIHKAARERTR